MPELTPEAQANLIFLHWKFGHGCASAPCQNCEATQQMIVDALRAVEQATERRVTQEIADLLVREEMPTANYWWERLNRRLEGEMP